MTAWMPVPIKAGAFVIARIFAGVDADHMVAVGELQLRPEEYADLVARLVAPVSVPATAGDGV